MLFYENISFSCYDNVTIQFSFYFFSTISLLKFIGFNLKYTNQQEGQTPHGLIALSKFNTILNNIII